MKISHFLSLVITLLLANFLQAVDKPNFVFFLVDDLGYMDIGANNPNTFYETPNIDRLANSGMRFTNGYAANPVCSPTRLSIMSGKYPTRFDATNFFSGTRSGKFAPAPLQSSLPLEEITLAEALKPLGYKTYFAGKWHLGPETHWPEHQGFDVNIGGHARGAPVAPGRYFSPYGNPRLKDGPKGEHLTDRLADETCKFIEENKDQPFLAYLSFYSVHTPLMGKKDLIAKYQARADKITGEEFADEEQVLPGGKERKVRIVQKHAVYAAMMETMDAAIGKVIKKIHDVNVADKTVVFFMSDNGGLSTSEGSPTSNLPLRGGKGWLYEGGIREPWIIHWPGVTKPGSVEDTPVISNDFFPTILDIAGIPVKSGQVDGVSLVSLLKQSSSLSDRLLYWHYPHYSNQGGIPGGAVRDGDWKLIERYEDGSVNLYNLKEDIGERNDVAAKHTDRANRMRTQLHNWYKEVDAKFLQAKKNGPEPWKPLD
ncbi:MAG: sulfatase [Pirellulales bacterium]